jgi:hypothetical protein
LEPLPSSGAYHNSLAGGVPFKIPVAVVQQDRVSVANQWLRVLDDEAVVVQPLVHFGTGIPSFALFDGE